MRPHLVILGALAALIACDSGTTPLPTSSSCDLSATALTGSEPSSLGLSGEDVLDLAVARFETVQVEWMEATAAPQQDALSFSFGSHDQVEERVQGGDCAARTWVSVEVPVTVTSTSGHLSAVDTVEVWGHLDDQGQPKVFVVWPHEEARMDTTLAGAYADAAEAYDDGLVEAYLSLGVHGWTDARTPLTQGIGLSADYDNAAGSSSVVLYACRPDGDTDAGCLTFASQED